MSQRAKSIGPRQVDGTSSTIYARVPTGLHQEIRALAQRSGMSLAMVVTCLLQQAVTDVGPDGKLKLEMVMEVER